jgi:hypothetical protein
MNLLKIEGHSKLRKDPQSGGIVNVDTKQYDNYLTSRNIAKNSYIEKQTMKEDLNAAKVEISEIRNDISEIKILLLALINK